MQVSISNLTPRRVGTSLLTLLVCDAIWFKYSTKHVYPPLKDVQITWGLIAWVALAKGVSAGLATNPKEALLWGASVGFICYAVFNGTELAIRRDWKPSVALIDTLWGTSVCALASYVVFLLNPPQK